MASPDLSDALTREVAEARAAGDPTRLMARIPYATFLGIRAESRGDELTLVLPFDQKLIGNPRLPALHGGVIGAFLEIAAILTLVWEAEVTVWPKTIDIAFDFLRSGRPVDTYARGILAKPGRRVANLRVEAWQDERRRPIAAAHGHFLLKT